MMYNKELQIAFMLNPKCGSQSLRLYLKFSNFKFLPKDNEFSDDLNKKHLTYKTCVDAYPNLKNYKIYGFFRDPMERFESAMNFLIKNRNTILYKDPKEDKFFEEHIAFFNKHTIFFKEQIEWLDGPNVTVLDFDNFEVELKKIVRPVFGEQLNHLNKSSAPIDMKSKFRIKQFVRTKYAADYEFAKRVLGKNYE